MKFEKDRPVGEEARRWYNDWVDNGNLEKYLSGKVIDVGFDGYIGAVPITEEAIGLGIDYPGYDGVNLPFETESIDGILSSHMLEHVPTENVSKVIQEWHRVLKVGKYAVISVPAMYRYEKKYPNTVKPIPGSHWNGDHKRFYTGSVLLKEIEDALKPNSYRIEFLRDNDKGYTYDIGPERHCGGQCEIMCVIQKLPEPKWELMPGLSETHTKNTIICGGSGAERVFTREG